jgi:hypothetical protein
LQILQVQTSPFNVGGRALQKAKEPALVILLFLTTRRKLKPSGHPVAHDVAHREV